MSVTVAALLTGKVAAFARGQTSAIVKRAVDEPVSIGMSGIIGDEQADQVNHGGVDKALHHYPIDHYPRWAAHAPEPGQLALPGAFGENISTYGVIETDVCIGDRFRMGTALIEVSQGRQPCWKQGEQLGWPALPALMVRERRCGWYYRVIEPGTAQAGDDMTLIERPLPDWSVARVFGLLIAGDHKRDPAALTVLAAMPQLFSGWRERACALQA